jgi:hypothetical protein
MQTTREKLCLDKRSLVQLKMVDMPTSTTWIVIFSDGAFEYGDRRIFKILRWMQNLYHSTSDHAIHMLTYLQVTNNF